MHEDPGGQGFCAKMLSCTSCFSHLPWLPSWRQPSRATKMRAAAPRVDVKYVADLLASGKAQRIIIMCGAGATGPGERL
eukprot:6192604-Pleurochrysis_carterae.AAC.2